jgi:hypothetical protein
MPKPSEALAKKDVVTETGMELPEYLRTENTGAGLENLDRNELKLPRLALAQGLSPQLDPDKPEFIEDLRQGDLFNSVTGEVFGRGPLYFTVLRIEKPRHIEFIPREQGGGVVDLNVPAGDPRTKFTTDEEGNSVPPVATKFLDFLIALLPLNPDAPEEAMKSVIALSCKSTALKAAKVLNSLLMYRSPKPTYAARFVLYSVKETNKKGTYWAYSIANAPVSGGGGWIVDPREFALSKSLHDTMQTTEVLVDRDGAATEGEETPEGVPF